MTSALAWIDHHFLEPLGSLVEFISSETVLSVPDEASSLAASWFLSPKQHGIEFILFNVFILWSFYYFYQRAVHDSLPLISQFIQERKAQQKLKENSVVEKFVQHGLLISICSMCVYKFRNNSWWFLAQPCHVDVICYLAMMLWCDSDKISSHLIFNIMINHSWGTILALVQPDFRDYWQFFEIEMFWVEHLMILLAPLYCVYAYRFQLLPLNFNLTMASFLAIAAYHSLVLQPLSLIVGQNLNYVTCPPPGPLDWFGKYYRVAMYTACLILTLLNRYFIWELFDYGINAVRSLAGHEQASILRSKRIRSLIKSE